MREHRTVSVNGIHLHAAISGTGPPVMLLHGFPETHRSWDLQVPVLVEHGYRVIVPDLRGYGASDRPETGYDLDTLARDVVALASAVAEGPVSLVGHDWGGAITWHVASHFPNAITRAVILDCPHPVLMARALRKNPEQIRRSWYMFFFQLPRLPELWLARRGGDNLTRMFREGSPRASDAPPEIVDAERRALLSPGALTAALSYYRTAFRDNARRLVTGTDAAYPLIERPVTLLWGEADSCLGLELIDGSERYAEDLSVHRIADAGHFVHQERPEAVNPLLLSALGR